jgi:uncharacterized membrane protein (UPF0127 family)
VLFAWFADTTTGLLRARNTAAPSDVAFADGEGYITEKRSATGPAEEGIRPQQPYRLATEAKRGYFGSNGIRPGSRAVFVPSP